MGMELLVGALAAWGGIMLLWTLAGFLYLPLSRGRGLTMTVVLSGRGTPPQLERYVRGLLWLRSLGLIAWEVVILSDGLSEEALNRCQQLIEKQQQISVLSTEALQDWMDTQHGYGK